VERAGGAAPPALADFPWARAAVLDPFVLADGSAAAAQATRVRPPDFHRPDRFGVLELR
jgi:hypothetical protein